MNPMTCSPPTCAPAQRPGPRRRAWLGMTATALLALGASAPAWAQDNTASAAAPAGISLDDARPLIEQGKVLVFDIREPQEHTNGIIRGARRLPLSQLPQRMSEIPKDISQPVLLICETQNRSSMTVKVLQNSGWTNVRHVQGGMHEWAKRGWPMVKP